jgi:hypothetical protein
MQRRTKLRILLLIAAAFILPGGVTSARIFAPQNASSASTTPSPANTSDPTIAPTPPANGSGMVWVNLGSGAYYKPGSRYYGKTKHGKYMLEDDAIRAGYHAASKK